jgi:hypothetical protein
MPPELVDAAAQWLGGPPQYRLALAIGDSPACRDLAWRIAEEFARWWPAQPQRHGGQVPPEQVAWLLNQFDALQGPSGQSWIIDVGPDATDVVGVADGTEDSAPRRSRTYNPLIQRQVVRSRAAKVPARHGDRSGIQVRYRFSSTLHTPCPPPARVASTA